MIIHLVAQPPGSTLMCGVTSRSDGNHGEKKKWGLLLKSYPPSLCLTGRDSDVGIVFKEGSCAELRHCRDRPSKTSPQQLPGKRHINDDLLLNGLGSLLHLLDVLSAGISDPARHVQEANGGDLHTHTQENWSSGREKPVKK